MTPVSKRRGRGLPALRSFARAYLFEGFGAEYGSPAGAARAFAADASTIERRALARALRLLADEAADWPHEQLATFFTASLGAAWATPTADQLRQMAGEVDPER